MFDVLEEIHQRVQAAFPGNPPVIPLATRRHFDPDPGGIPSQAPEECHSQAAERIDEILLRSLAS